MSIKHGFWNSVNSDRMYNADDLLKPIGMIVSDGIYANENGLSDSLKVKYNQPDGNKIQLRVCAGSGFFGKKWFEMTADELLEVPTPHTQYTRIDSVVVRCDFDARTVSLEYIQGLPAENPVAPDIQRSSSVKEYRLANISVAANTTEVTQSNITDTRPSADCGILTNLLQNSDISSTYSQWESQFREFLAEKENEFDNKLNELIDVDAETVLNLSNRVEKLEGITEALWTGVDVMGADAAITPSKSLSECNNGWVLCFSAYNSTTGEISNTRCKFIHIPKKYLNNASTFDITESFVYALGSDGTIENAAKRVYISDTQIAGYAGNSANTYNAGIALTAVYEY